MIVSTAPRSNIKAPFPWFGGKRRAAHIVWPRFGNVPNYVEPFAGSLAVMLARPHEAKNETVNDLDCYLANFWRALQQAPAEVAAHADWPVNEADLHARHQWLHAQAEFREKMHTDPDHYDARVAGWWVWGISAWIGDNWCRTTKRESMPNLKSIQGVHAFAGDGTGLDMRRPNLQAGGQGVHNKRLFLIKQGAGVHRKRPDIRKGGRGVARQLLDISGNSGACGRGVNAKYSCGAGSRKLPDVSGHHGNSGRGTHAKYCSALEDYFEALAVRLRRVRVCCGDWARILGPSPTVHIGVTAVFLDPPYGVSDRDKVYNHDSLDLAGDVRAWCQDHEVEPKLRIALCGYAGEHDELEARGWDVVAWKAGGGYAARNPDNQNAHRERLWFSPTCPKVDRPEQAEMWVDG